MRQAENNADDLWDNFWSFMRKKEALSPNLEVACTHDQLVRTPERIEADGCDEEHIAHGGNTLDRAL